MTPKIQPTLPLQKEKIMTRKTTYPPEYLKAKNNFYSFKKLEQQKMWD